MTDNQNGGMNFRKSIIQARQNIFDTVTGVTNNPLNRARPELTAEGEVPQKPIGFGLGLMPGGETQEDAAPSGNQNQKKTAGPGLIFA